MVSGAPLTKRQRQALRRSNAAAATPPPSEGSSAPASPPQSQPQMGDVLAMVRAREAEKREREGERELGEERERASPSKYPTPLPDEEEEGEEEEEERRAAGYPLLRALGPDDNDGLLGAIDMETEPLPPLAVNEPPFVVDEPPLVDLGFGYGADIGLMQTARPEPQQRSDRESTIRASSGRRAGMSHHGHLRAPEIARPSPPRALSALAHARTRRALAAVTTTAVAAYEALGAPSTTYNPSSTSGPYGTARRGSGADTSSPIGVRDRDRDRDVEEGIIAARWDEVECEAGQRRKRSRRLLTLTYAAGVQVWDTSALDGVREVLNLCVPTVAATNGVPLDDDGEYDAENLRGPIIQAGVLPLLRGHGCGKALEMGILTAQGLCVYSLSTGRVIARWAPTHAAAPTSSVPPGRAVYGHDGRRLDDEDHPEPPAMGTPCAFEAAGGFLVVTTHSPPALVILSRPDLAVLHLFPASVLAQPPPPVPISDASKEDSPPGPDHTDNPANVPPGPVFALHGRLLAFLAQSPASSPPPGPASIDPVGTATRTAEKWGRALGRFLSRSAPTGTAALASVSSALSASSAALLGAAGRHDAFVRVVDLGAEEIKDVHAWAAGRAAVSALAFSADGTRLFASRRDGLGAEVWSLRPARRAGDAEDLPAPALMYELRRGRTGAVIDTIASARDGRFVALATRRRTVHVFAVNPYGGRADRRSHLAAKGRDADGGEEHQSTEVHPVVRLRLPGNVGAQQQQPNAPPAPLAIAFVPPAGNAPSSTLRSPVSPLSPSGSAGVQDVLVFDPADGVLSLRRVTLALEAPHVAGLPISMSLPAGRLMGTSMSASPPPAAFVGSSARGGAAESAAGGSVGGEAQLGGKEAVVATWNLRRRRGWAEIRWEEGGEESPAALQPLKQDWLAQAELSTFSRVPGVLPRPIYLSHQFSFHTLGEDYHALIRRYQFSFSGTKIDVRREVEISAFAAGTGGTSSEAFVEGYASSSPRAIRQRRRTSASFDEPLANALAGANYARPDPVLPMLPNGSPMSFRNSIPIRAVSVLGDGVAEGLGRLGREMRHQAQKQLARSPLDRHGQTTRGGDNVEASVPLEFDEEDQDFAIPPGSEDFLRVHADRQDDDAVSTVTSRNEDSLTTSVSTPATSARALEDELRADDLGEGDDAYGWAEEDKLAVEEAEQFNDISVLGFLDEEQAAVKAETERRRGAVTRGLRGKKRRY